MPTFAAVAFGQMHGYVEPCTVAFVEDQTIVCEACPLSHDPEHCQKTLGAKGYRKKCRTGGHSAPSEVWCKDRQPGTQGSLTYLAMLAGLAAFMGVFLFWKRRGSRRQGH